MTIDPKACPMLKTSDEWFSIIEATPHRSGKDFWYTATCPICGATEEASVLGSDASAQVASRGKIMTHIHFAHKEVVFDEADLMARVKSAAEATMGMELKILKHGRVERTFTSCLANEIAKRIVPLHQANLRCDPFYNKHLGAAKRLGGKLIELDIAVHTRSFDSFTAASGNPTITINVSPHPESTSTSTG